MKSLIEECKRARSDGTSIDDLVRDLHDRRCTIAESIKVIMAVFDQSLGEAKRVVATNSTWADVTKATQPLHDSLETLSDQLRAESEADE